MPPLNTYANVEQRSKAWYDARELFLGASEAATVLDQNRFQTPAELFERKLKRERLTPNAAMQWGIIHEEDGLRMFCTMFRTKHIETTGLWINSDWPLIGASPDAMIYDTVTDTHELLEIKCPFPYKPVQAQKYKACEHDWQPNPKLGPADVYLECTKCLCLNWEGLVYQKKKPALPVSSEKVPRMYWIQQQQQCAVLDCDRNYIFFWSPDHGCQCHLTMRDRTWWFRAAPKLQHFQRSVLDAQAKYA